MPPQNPEDARWFVDNVLPHEAALRSWLQTRFGAQVEIDDVVQEAYARLLKLRAEGTMISAKAFLFHAARNLALNHVRHRSYTHPAEVTEVDVSGVLDT